MCALFSVLTWKFEPFRHLARVRSGRFGGLGLCQWVFLVLCGSAGFHCRLWGRQRLPEATRARGGSWGLEHAAEVGRERKKRTKWMTRVWEDAALNKVVTFVWVIISCSHINFGKVSKGNMPSYAKGKWSQTECSPNYGDIIHWSWGPLWSGHLSSYQWKLILKNCFRTSKLVDQCNKSKLS